MDSVAMCEQVRAITTDRLGKYLGRLDTQSLRAIEECLKITLDLP